MSVRDSILTSRFLFHTTAVNVNSIPFFDAFPNQNICAIIYHLLILMDLHPHMIVNTGYKYPIKPDVIATPRDVMVESMLALFLKIIRRNHSLLKNPHVIKISLFNLNTFERKQLFFKHIWSYQPLSDDLKKRLARYIAKIFGIKIVKLINAEENFDVEIDPEYLPFKYMKRKYPNLIHRQMIYANFVRFIEGTSERKILSDKITVTPKLNL